MGRPTFREIYMRMAVMISERSTCKRLSVGCVIVTPDFREMLSLGYNGNASSLPNTCDSDEPGKCGCLHSEENAIINCSRSRETRKIVFCTHLPCVMCAKRLINLGGVEQVYYLHDYRIQDSLNLLRQRSIRIDQYLLPSEEEEKPCA
jgi:dCMP deaminase